MQVSKMKIPSPNYVQSQDNQTRVSATDRSIVLHFRGVVNTFCPGLSFVLWSLSYSSATDSEKLCVSQHRQDVDRSGVVLGHFVVGGWFPGWICTFLCIWVQSFLCPRPAHL